jgi:hypothetical protein
VVSLTSSSGGYINGRNSANLELLIDKTSLIYLYVKLKALASWIFLSFTRFWRNSDSFEYKNKSARRGAQFVLIGINISIPITISYLYKEHTQTLRHCNSSTGSTVRMLIQHNNRNSSWYSNNHSNCHT